MEYVPGALPTNATSVYGVLSALGHLGTGRIRTSNIRARTSVRTTSHAHNDGVVTEPVLLADFLDFVDEDGEVLFRHFSNVRKRS